jgi:hypothetical protein
MNENGNIDKSAAESRDAAICTRILDDTITGLAVRFGVAPVVAALTEIVGCYSCVTNPLQGAGMRALIKKMGRANATDGDDEQKP